MFSTIAPFLTVRGGFEAVTIGNDTDAMPTTAPDAGAHALSPSATTGVAVRAVLLTSFQPSLSSASPTSRNLMNAVVEPVTLSVLWVASLVGNSLVCLVIQRSRRLQSTTNYFVVSLAGADLAYAVLVMPPLLADLLAQHWLGGSALCKLVRYVQLVVPVAMVAVLIAICVDRFYTIIYPLSFKVSRGGAKKMILLSWLVAVVLASPGLYVYGLQRDPTTGQVHCAMFLHGGRAGLYVVFLAVTAYFLPILGLSVGYARILRFVWHAGVGGGRAFQRATNPVPRGKVKMVKLIIVVNLVILLLMAPWFIGQLHYCARPAPSPRAPAVYVAVVWVFFANTVAKPALYLCYNSNFRRGCKEVLCMSSMKCYRSSAYTITATSTFGKRNHVGITEAPIYGRQQHRARVPAPPGKVVGRTVPGDKLAWPIANQAPSTYL